MSRRPTPLPPICDPAEVATVIQALAGAAAPALLAALGPWRPAGPQDAAPRSDADRRARLGALLALKQRTHAFRREAPEGLPALAQGRLPARRVPVQPGRIPLPPGAAAELDALIGADAPPAGFGCWHAPTPAWRPASS